MLYYLFQYLESQFNLPGAGLFQYITFRGAAAFIVGLLVSSIYGKKIIQFLKKQQVGETIRDLGLEGQNQKAGTPTMGGIIIIFSTLIPVILLTRIRQYLCHYTFDNHHMDGIDRVFRRLYQSL